MNRENISLVAQWQYVDGRLDRRWSSVSDLGKLNNAAALNEFHAEMSTWLFAHGTPSRLN